jgi:hypothetical protein
VSIVVFLGPTLSVVEARAELDASFRPPVSHGDVLRAVREAPQAIGIVDGYFERVPAVWHKEILWALSRGVHVFGAASMGALRAAELAPFGMEGVGAVFEAYAGGELTADDEVAVAHAPADDGYRPLSVAMVDIRATLRAAVTAGVISSVAGEALERAGQRLFYPDRCYPMLLQQAVAEGVSPAKVEALRLFLAGGKVHQKRLDALALLRRMRERAPFLATPKQVPWRFEHTDAWEQMLVSLPQSPAPRARPEL